MASAWKCRNCNTENSAESEVCSNCGASSKSPAPKGFGLAQLVIQASLGKIGAEAFIDGVYEAYGLIEETFIQARASVKESPNPVSQSLAKTINEELDDIYYVFRLALMQFEAFHSRGDIPCLRVGMLLVDTAQDGMHHLLGVVGEEMAGNKFADRRDIVASIASEVMEGTMSLGEYRRNLATIIHRAEKQLRDIEEKLQQSFYFASLLPADVWQGTPEPQYRRALFATAASLYKLSNTVGEMVVSLYNPSYANASASNLLEELAYVDGAAEYASQVKKAEAEAKA